MMFLADVIATDNVGWEILKIILSCLGTGIALVILAIPFSAGWEMGKNTYEVMDKLNKELSKEDKKDA